MTKGKFRPWLSSSIILIHLPAVYAMWYAYYHGFSLMAWTSFIALFLASGLGISVGYHRFFTHESFECGIRFQKVLAALGSLALEGTIGEWVANHRQHHAFPDKVYDVHSPLRYPGLRGLAWSHIGWIFYDVIRPPGYKPANLQNHPVMAWQKRWYYPIVISGFALPFLLAGWQGLILGGFVRLVLAWHITWSINSICHKYGRKNTDPDTGAFVTADESRNNPLIALFALIGEGWHSNHHENPNCAFLGRRWWQVDLGNLMIVLLEKTGLVWDVKRPQPTMG